MCKFIAERIITCQCTNENLGNSLTKRDFRLQSGNLVYKMRFSFTKRDSWVTNGTLALHFTVLNNIGLLHLFKHIIYSLFFQTSGIFFCTLQEVEESSPSAPIPYLIFYLFLPYIPANALIINFLKLLINLISSHSYPQPLHNI